MSRALTQLQIYADAAYTGLLSRAPGTWTFSYDPSPSPVVALTMPRAVPTYTHHSILPAFDQQIPEMDLRLFPSGLWKQLQPDEMGLLLIAGNRRLGRLSYSEPGGAPTESMGLVMKPGELARIENGEEFLLDTFARLAYVPGISGVQPKTLFALSELRSATATIDTHILKGNRRDYPFATLVEMVSLEAAEAAGLSVPARQISGDGQLLAIERFDLRDGVSLGFDEACALTGRLSKEKYDGSYEAMCKSLVQFVAADKRHETALQLLTQLTLCYAIENGDAHLKNFGLLYTNANDAALSPSYDLLTTTCFEGMHRDAPALMLDGRNVWDAFRDLERMFRGRFNIPSASVRQTFGSVLAAVVATRPRFAELSERFPAAAAVLTRADEAWQRGIGRLQQAIARM